jgi:hypothetical protein
MMSGIGENITSSTGSMNGTLSNPNDNAGSTGFFSSYSTLQLALFCTGSVVAALATGFAIYAHKKAKGIEKSVFSMEEILNTHNIQGVGLYSSHDIELPEDALMDATYTPLDQPDPNSLSRSARASFWRTSRNVSLGVATVGAGLAATMTVLAKK